MTAAERSFARLFIYLFPAGGAAQRVCLFRLNKHVPKSPPWDAEKSTHRGWGWGGRTSCSRWTSLALFANNEPSPPLPLLDGKRERLLRACSSQLLLGLRNAARPASL